MRNDERLERRRQDGSARRFAEWLPGIVGSTEVELPIEDDDAAVGETRGERIHPSNLLYSLDLPIRGLFAFLTATSLFAAARLAHAEVPKEAGSFVVSLDHVVPVLSIAHDSALDVSSTNVTTGNPPGATTPYNVPRWGFDVMPTRHLTLGATTSLLVATGSPSNASGADPIVTLFSFGPRVGWIAPVAKDVGFWPRAGFVASESYSRGYDDAKRPTRELRSDVGVSAELAIVAAPIPVLGVTMGIGTIVPFAGKVERTVGNVTTNGGVAHTQFVIDGGILAHF